MIVRDGLQEISLAAAQERRTGNSRRKEHDLLLRSSGGAEGGKKGTIEGLHDNDMAMDFGLLRGRSTAMEERYPGWSILV